MRTSGPEDPGARLGWLSRLGLGSLYGCFQVRADLGHNLLGGADPDFQPHSQFARRWPVVAEAAGLTVTLCPATCSLTETVTGRLRSVGYDQNLPAWEPVTKFPTRLGHAVGARCHRRANGYVGADDGLMAVARLPC